MSLREIKFRIWNTRRKEMIDCCDLYCFEEEGVRENGDFNSIILQFTGLHDEEGHEIYEGDILEFDYREQSLFGTVKFELGMFIICSNDLPDSYITMFDLHMHEETIEAKIVGNELT